MANLILSNLLQTPKSTWILPHKPNRLDSTLLLAILQGKKSVNELHQAQNALNDSREYPLKEIEDRVVLLAKNQVLNLDAGQVSFNEHSYVYCLIALATTSMSREVKNKLLQAETAESSFVNLLVYALLKTRLPLFTYRDKITVGFEKLMLSPLFLQLPITKSAQEELRSLYPLFAWGV